MATGIEWTDETWNPVTGCDKVSQGCKHCYAERMAKRLAGRFSYPEAPNQFDVTLHKDRLTEPLSWRKPRKVFVCSMSDLFHPEVPEEFIWQVIEVARKTEDHIFQILTKRPERMKKVLSDLTRRERNFRSERRNWNICPSDNVWLGVSVENQEKADERIPILLKTPAAVRFVSAEPLLGEINFDTWVNMVGGPTWLDQLDWVIAGGESGPGARPPHPDWFRLLRDQCVTAGVPFFFKQWGGPHHKGWVIDGEIYQGNMLDGETYEQYPKTYQEVDPVEETQIMIDHHHGSIDRLINDDPD